MGGILKRRRPPHLLRPDQMLSSLSSLRLTALLQHGGVWLAVPPHLAELLNQCCTGQMDGGPGTAEEVAAVLTPLVGEPADWGQQQQPEGSSNAAARSAAAAVATAPALAVAAVPGATVASEGVAAMSLACQSLSSSLMLRVQAGGQEVQLQQQQQQQAELEVRTEGASQQGPAMADPPPFQQQQPLPPQQPVQQLPAVVCGPTADGAGASGDPWVRVTSGSEPGGPSPGSHGRVGDSSGGIAAVERGAGGEAGVCGDVERPERRMAAGAGADATGAPGGAAAGAATVAVTSVAAASVPGDGGGGGGRGGGSGGRFRGRGRPRVPAPPAPPFSPAAAGCRLVAVRLTLEEAFFLHHVLRCLQVYELQPGSPLPATADHVRRLDDLGLWRACRRIRSNFVTSYVAYHHLKAKGWIPRSGLLYGVDYVVYQLHPAGAHSNYGVMVLPLGRDGRPMGPHAPPLSWLDLQITNRLINQVVKRLILMYVYEQPGPDHTTPACLQNFAVEERIVRRWVPDATRE
ncbi:hypothetical protein Agub_g12219 [Astrephomene gubernaculifera]|uniref:tRNA-intron lyase n=1 Tax=Astrephomene gubernaculifera TaxID=47775 RepID=A0AAD3HRL6_9CHLO|nr:hypothetical protein Agub_g12219 [Astrephomene gubernaculifera]